MSEVRPSYFGFRSYLWERLPLTRPLIAQVEGYGQDDDGGHVPDADAYQLMSEAFFRGLLLPAVRSADTSLALRCLEMVEEMLDSGDDNLTVLVLIRVIHKAYEEPLLVDLVHTRGGALTRAALAKTERGAVLPAGKGRVGPGQRRDLDPALTEVSSCSSSRTLVLVQDAAKTVVPTDA